MHGTVDDFLLKLLRHYSDGGEVLLNVLSDFRSCTPLGLHSCRGVSRAEALANNQAATISLDSCCRCGICALCCLRRLFTGNALAEMLALTLLVVCHMGKEEILV